MTNENWKLKTKKRPLKYQIDQSGKIENTERPTVIAVCNHTTLAVLIPAKVKRQFQARIGNEPKVHYVAHDVYSKKKKADKIISLREILRTTKKADGRLRECLSTLVGARARSLGKSYHPRTKKSINQKIVN